MKIFYLATVGLPTRSANSLQIIRMCDAFAACGHSISIIFPENKFVFRSSKEKKQEIIQFYAVDYDVNLLPVFSCQYVKKIGKAIDASRSAILSKLKNADLAITRDLRQAFFSCLLRVPTVLELHEPLQGRLAHFYLRFLNRNKSFLGIVSITHALKVFLENEFQEIGCNVKIINLPDGVSLDRFKKNDDEKVPIDIISKKNKYGYIVGYSGHLYPGKGVDLILDLAEKMPDVFFLIVGGMEKDVQHYSAIANSKGLTNFFFTGFVEYRDVPSYLSICGALLLPNQKSVQGIGGGDIGKWTSPLKLFEYMVSGIPIVASDLPVLREVLSPENAVLCMPEDLDAWRESVYSVLKDGKLSEKISSQAEKDARQYSWESRVEKILEEFFETIE